MKQYIETQNRLIEKYGIDLCDGTKCDDGDWDRTHAHVKQRRICKWKQVNSIESTFTLLHEIGHIMTTTSQMRRCVSEYFATMWAIEESRRLCLHVPVKIIEKYQDYIYRELLRGKRRGGSCYPGDLRLPKPPYNTSDYFWKADRCPGKHL